MPFDIPTLTAIEFVALAFVESARGAETDGIKVGAGAFAHTTTRLACGCRRSRIGDAFVFPGAND